MKNILSSAVVILIWLSFFTAHAVAKDSAAKNQTPQNKDLPIEIASNRLDAYNEKRLVIFSGDAVATQGDKTIKADRLLVYYKKDEQRPKTSAAKNVEQSGDLERIEAKGKVTVIQGERVVTGNEAVYSQEAQKITMTGNAVMREGKNVVRGETIVVYLNENRGVVEGNAENKRVKATIYPKSEEGKNKPAH